MNDRPENAPILDHPTDEASVFLPQNPLDRAAEIASLPHVTNAFATADNDFHKGPDDINERIIHCGFDAMAE